MTDQSIEWSNPGALDKIVAQLKEVAEQRDAKRDVMAEEEHAAYMRGAAERSEDHADLKEHRRFLRESLERSHASDDRIAAALEAIAEGLKTR